MGWTLVTGGAKGIGAAICQKLAKNRHDLVIHYRKSKDAAEVLCEACRSFGVKAESIQGDFSEDVTPFLAEYQERFSQTEAIVHNVGHYETTPLLDIPFEHWVDIYQTNLHAPFALTKALLPSLKEARGAIIHIGVAGLDLWRTDPHSSVYRMTKMGLWMLTRSLAKELAPHQVCVNMVSPGQLENSINAPSAFSLPMKRLGKTEEVADTVAYLLSESGAYITGQNIDVAGGYKL